MKVTLVAGDPDSQPTTSPTLYKTDRGSWVVDAPDALAALNLPDGETAVEIPGRMIQFFK
jgi:hypothetical protein